MGTTVIGGMLAASLIGIILVPAIFYAVETLSGTVVRAGTALSTERRAHAGRLTR
jgi:hypothetical protein